MMRIYSSAVWCRHTPLPTPQNQHWLAGSLKWLRRVTHFNSSLPSSPFPLPSPPLPPLCLQEWAVASLQSAAVVGAWAPGFMRVARAYLTETGTRVRAPRWQSNKSEERQASTETDTAEARKHTQACLKKNPQGCKYRGRQTRTNNERRMTEAKYWAVMDNKNQKDLKRKRI